MADLSASCRCWTPDKRSVTSEAGKTPGAMKSAASKPTHTAAPVNVLKNNTGSTALSRTACLLQSSYTPRNSAEIRAAAIQCNWFKKKDGRTLAARPSDDLSVHQFLLTCD